MEPRRGILPALYHPAVQLVQVAVPVLVAKLPAAHDEQVLTPDAAYLPAPQMEHEVEAEDAVYRPAAHELQLS